MLKYIYVFVLFQIDPSAMQKQLIRKKKFRKNGYPENSSDKCFKNLLNNFHLVKE